MYVLAYVLQQRVVDRKFVSEPLFVAARTESKSLRDSPQSETLRRGFFLALDVRASDDEPETVQRRIRQVVIFEDRLEGTTLASMVQPHFGEFRSVERNRIFLAGSLEKLLFGHKQEFGSRVNESFDEPGAGHSVHFDVLPCDPSHGFTSWPTIGTGLPPAASPVRGVPHHSHPAVPTLSSPHRCRSLLCVRTSRQTNPRHGQFRPSRQPACRRRGRLLQVFRTCSHRRGG